MALALAVMSSGGCGISLDRGSVSKEFQFQYCSSKKMNICLHQYGQRDRCRRDQDYDDETALGVRPKCLQPHVQQLRTQRNSAFAVNMLPRPKIHV